jgi:hypothetical protein
MAVKLRSLVAGMTTVFFLCGGMAAAYTSGTYGSGTYGSCEYGNTCSITLTSGGTVHLDVTPATGGRCTIQSDTASVLTDDSNGYTLTLADNTTNTALDDGSATIAATGATIGSPAALTANTWGYRVDGLGSFGAGPTTAQSNISVPSTVFAGIKASNQTADIIATTSSAADPAQVTTIWYGACADTSLSSGIYTTQVTYTAIAN